MSSNCKLTLSGPQDVTHIIKTRSRFWVWVGIGHISGVFNFFFSWLYEKFNLVATKKLLKIFLSSIKTKVASYKISYKTFLFPLKIGLAVGTEQVNVNLNIYP